MKFELRQIKTDKRTPLGSKTGIEAVTEALACLGYQLLRPGTKIRCILSQTWRSESGMRHKRGCQKADKPI